MPHEPPSPGPTPKPFLPGADWQPDNGLAVFTAAYHIHRRSCGGPGCRHRPYEQKHLAGVTQVHP